MVERGIWPCLFCRLWSSHETLLATNFRIGIGIELESVGNIYRGEDHGPREL